MWYEFKCEEHGIFKVKQSIHDEHTAYCPQCGKPAQRIYHGLGRYYDHPAPLYHKDGSFEEKY
uniref:Putative regulatory protein FmdB zinc ribbon domain-containing protein n=1 Tax=viral metagenome TaxID=1070528 RepID=A0A6M3J2H3_9ZZZZ